ncbi:hypothetical protein N6H05_23425 [Sphingobium sp. WTD-1]|uniref:hypothetical protein n=1 Tax=Sphingobium sp. WTD-1 TaxID=2979467 RepID=UPI0024DED18A|nr:hypothetical protein [Sphingobium sp. WTD-1]WIA55930.1 hypothetical protein N6H05_23425 [Sphingobium sp. WTD-1]
MTHLSDAIPLEHFKTLFSTVEEVIVARNTAAYYVRDSASASTTNLFVWDEAIGRGLVKDGEEMRKYHPHKLRKAYGLTKDRIGEEPFKEVYCVKYFNEYSTQNFFGEEARFPFAQIDLVQCYPGDIHISDVTLLDLTKPLMDQSKIAPRSHRGLHVFPMLLDGLKSVAKQKGIRRLSLMAASPAAHETFSRYGVTPTDAPASQYAFKNLGFSHAMALTLDP